MPVMRSRYHHRPAISRAEVVVILLILALAACLISPALQRARERARRTICQNNLRDLSGEEAHRRGKNVGLRQVCVATGAFPAGTVVRAGLPPEKRLSWYVGSSVFLLPKGRLVIQLDQPWDSPANLQPMLALPDSDDQKNERTDFRCFPLSHCPSAPTFAPPEMPEFASYIGIAGLGSDAPRLPLASPRAGMWGYDRRTRPADVSRGLSETMFLAETALQSGPWTAGGPPTVRGIDMDQRPLLGVGGQLGGLHPGGFNALFVDGSVRFLNEIIDPAVLSAMMTIHVKE